MAIPIPDDGSQNKPGSGFRETLASVRGLLFYLWTFAIAMPSFVVMCAIAPFVLLLDKFKRGAQHAVNNMWAKLTCLPFYPITIEGKENLPANDEAVVYVANHESFLDIYSLFHLDRSFKFISKTSNFLIPIIGWSMFLTGHVMINRVDRRSQMKCLGECRTLLESGASCLFFPEGTRTSDGRMDSFKKGAFSVAAKAGVRVVPVTLCGTGSLMPNKQESKLYPGKVKIVVHKPIEASKDAQAMLDEAQAKIASSLPAWKTALLKK